MKDQKNLENQLLEMIKKYAVARSNGTIQYAKTNQANILKEILAME